MRAGKVTSVSWASSIYNRPRWYIFSLAVRMSNDSQVNYISGILPRSIIVVTATSVLVIVNFIGNGYMVIVFILEVRPCNSTILTSCIQNTFAVPCHSNAPVDPTALETTNPPPLQIYHKHHLINRKSSTAKQQFHEPGQMKEEDIFHFSFIAMHLVSETFNLKTVYWASSIFF